MAPRPARRHQRRTVFGGSPKRSWDTSAPCKPTWCAIAPAGAPSCGMWCGAGDEPMRHPRCCTSRHYVPNQSTSPPERRRCSAGLQDRYAVPATASPPNVLVYHELPGRPLRTILLKDGYADLPQRTVYGDVMPRTGSAPRASRGPASFGIGAFPVGEETHLDRGASPLASPRATSRTVSNRNCRTALSPRRGRSRRPV